MSGLVGYSDSESSDTDQKPAPKSINKSGAASKLAFQKVIDRSNPHKIKVTLPEIVKANSTDDLADDGPPAKRAKVGGGGFTGFNELLPAPKRSVHTNGGSNTGIRRGGLGSGVNLKTGAAPGFSREPMNVQEPEGFENDAGSDDFTATNRGMDEEPTGAVIPSKANGSEKSKEEPKKQWNAMMFKPLSVARKQHKKKKPATTAPVTAEPDTGSATFPSPKAPPKVSLFSIANTGEEDPSFTGGNGDYQPLVYQTTIEAESMETIEDAPNSLYLLNAEESTLQSAPSKAQSLDDIASDLNLSASAKRQLFGRQRGNAKGNPAAINVVNFNTDQEYAANELLRQAGEQAVHNPVRAVAAGKHSLKQLINSVSSQKEALEEHFATGRRNKKEAGSKYGW